jgi:hypothetical protein
MTKVEGRTDEDAAKKDDMAIKGLVIRHSTLGIRHSD